MASISQNAKYAPGIADYIKQCDEVMPPNFYEYPLARQREMYMDMFRAFPCERPASVTVTDGQVPAGDHSIPIRVYRSAERGRQPCLIYMHGGGFVLGDLETHDTIAADLAAKAGITVVTVAFRLAPEHPYPAAINDCYSVLSYVAAHSERFGIDPTRMGGAGDSCGGTFTAVLAMMSRDRGGPAMRGQILINPVLDLHRWARQPSSPPGDFFHHEMLYFTKTYLGEAVKNDDPYASPLMASSFEGFPPAYVWAVEHDILNEDATIYAQRLREAGVAAELKIEPGLVHGCLRARHYISVVAEAFDRVSNATRRLLHDGVLPAG